MAEKRRHMSEQQALEILRKNGVDVKGKDISRGSYPLSIWSAIDCLIHHIGGYRIVN